MTDQNFILCKNDGRCQVLDCCEKVEKMAYIGVGPFGTIGVHVCSGCAQNFEYFKVLTEK